MHDRDNNAELLELALVSLRRKSRYRDDIVVFTDFDRKLKDEDELAISRVVVEPGVTEDPRNFRIYMNRFYDFCRHKKLIYMDFDILVLKNVNRVFSYIRTDDLYFTYAPVFPWKNEAFMAGDYIDDYLDKDIVRGSATGICSGIFGLKTQGLDKLLDHWQRVLQSTPTDNDQHALNEVLVRGMAGSQPFPNEWVAYPFQVRQDSDDRRIFGKKRDFIFYHFNPTNNLVKLQMMTDYLEKG
jgi:hypothetical protein